MANEILYQCSNCGKAEQTRVAAEIIGNIHDNPELMEETI